MRHPVVIGRLRPASIRRTRYFLRPSATFRIGRSSVSRKVGAVGEYQFRVRRRDRGVSDDYAIRRARETAFADGVKIAADPIVTTKRVPLP
jgi:hypothetical protein